MLAAHKTEGVMISNRKIVEKMKVIVGSTRIDKIPRSASSSMGNTSAKRHL